MSGVISCDSRDSYYALAADYLLKDVKKGDQLQAFDSKNCGGDRCWDSMLLRPRITTLQEIFI